MEIKESGWFAADREVQKALFLLSDGGFRLYLYLCFTANRSTARVFIHYGEVATKLKRSPRYIATHFKELRTAGTHYLDYYLVSDNGYSVYDHSCNLLSLKLNLINRSVCNLASFC